MLKKAGIIVAAAAAGLLAVSSFAFADTTVNKDNLTANCAFTATTNGQSTASNSGLANLLATVVGSAVVNGVAQVPVASCNNVDVEDVVDDNSNNVTKDIDKTWIKDSYNH